MIRELVEERAQVSVGWKGQGSREWREKEGEETERNGGRGSKAGERRGREKNTKERSFPNPVHQQWTAVREEKHEKSLRGEEEEVYCKLLWRRERGQNFLLSLFLSQQHNRTCVLWEKRREIGGEHAINRREAKKLHSRLGGTRFPPEKSEKDIKEKQRSKRGEQERGSQRGDIIENECHHQSRERQGISVFIFGGSLETCREEERNDTFPSLFD